jgi:hypothetical protein
MKDGECKGLIAWNLNDGTIHRFRAHSVIIATVVMVKFIILQHQHILVQEMGMQWF